VIAAQLIVRRPRGNPYTTLGSGLLSKSLYLAEGFTNLTFHETIVLLNPNRVAARVRVRLLPANGRHARLVNLVVAGRHSAVLDVNRRYPGVSLSALVASDQPIAVERVLTFGERGYGATGNGGTTLAATSWLCAEGATDGQRQTFLTILNPSSRRVTVTALLADPRGRVVAARTIEVEAGHRGTMRLNDTVRATAFAATVSSDVPVVVERPYYLGNPKPGTHRRYNRLRAQRHGLPLDLPRRRYDRQ